MKKGVNTAGNKGILQCNDCVNWYTSEDLAVSLLVNKYGVNRVYADNVKPTYDDGFWERSLRLSKSGVLMEMNAMWHCLPKCRPQIY